MASLSSLRSIAILSILIASLTLQFTSAEENITTKANTKTKVTKKSTSKKASIDNDRFALIIAPAGDTSRHTMWLTHPDDDPATKKRKTKRNWDLALLYYGDNENFTCPECIAVWRGKGAKWNVVHRFLNDQPGFRNLSTKYAAVTIMDDDLQITANVLNSYFELFIGYNLLIAQPSCCPGSYSYWWPVTGQRDGFVLHYTSFVELMAPTLSTSFFDAVVRASLEDAYTGWGLDFVWPYLAGWPRDKVAVIDLVCMLHGGQGPRQRVYDSGLPMSPWQEWDKQLLKYNLTEEAVILAGLEWKTPAVFGDIVMNSSTMVPTVKWKDVVTQIKQKNAQEEFLLEEQKHTYDMMYITPLAVFILAFFLGISIAISQRMGGTLRNRFTRLRNSNRK